MRHLVIVFFFFVSFSTDDDLTVIWNAENLNVFSMKEKKNSSSIWVRNILFGNFWQWFELQRSDFVYNEHLKDLKQWHMRRHTIFFFLRHFWLILELKVIKFKSFSHRIELYAYRWNLMYRKYFGICLQLLKIHWISCDSM